MTDESSPEDRIREEVENFLMKNFPQIQMHGGTAEISEVDADEGYVEIALGGACSGCGISPMTTQAIMVELPKEVESVHTVDIHTGDSGGFGVPDDAPF